MSPVCERIATIYIYTNSKNWSPADAGRTASGLLAPRVQQFTAKCLDLEFVRLSFFQPHPHQVTKRHGVSRKQAVRRQGLTAAARVELLGRQGLQSSFQPSSVGAVSQLLSGVEEFSDIARVRVVLPGRSGRSVHVPGTPRTMLRARSPRAGSRAIDHRFDDPCRRSCRKILV